MNGTQSRLNYTSETTGNPKGGHHRGAYLNAMSNIVSWGMPPHSTYSGPCRCSIATVGALRGRLLPMQAPTCRLRRVDPRLIFDAIRTHTVTHYQEHRSCIPCSAMPPPSEGHQKVLWPDCRCAAPAAVI